MQWQKNTFRLFTFIKDVIAELRRELAFQDLRGSGLIASEPELVYSAWKPTNGGWLLRRPVSMAQRSRQLSMVIIR